MPAVADLRPPGLDVPFRPGTTVTLTMAWPDGALAGRTFASTLGGTALTVVSDGDSSLTVSASAATTGAVTGPVPWLLLRDGTVAMVGTWVASNDPSTVTATSVEVTLADAEVAVTVLGAGANPAGFAFKESDGAGGYRWPGGIEPAPGTYRVVVFTGPDNPLTAVTGGRNDPADWWVT